LIWKKMAPQELGDRLGKDGPGWVRWSFPGIRLSPLIGMRSRRERATSMAGVDALSIVSNDAAALGQAGNPTTACPRFINGNDSTRWEGRCHVQDSGSPAAELPHRAVRTVKNPGTSAPSHKRER
jgi:hypothetical protein